MQHAALPRKPGSVQIYLRASSGHLRPSSPLPLPYTNFSSHRYKPQKSYVKKRTLLFFFLSRSRVSRHPPGYHDPAVKVAREPCSVSSAAPKGGKEKNYALLHPALNQPAMGPFAPAVIPLFLFPQLRWCNYASHFFRAGTFSTAVVARSHNISREEYFCHKLKKRETRLRKLEIIFYFFFEAHFC